MSNGHIGKPVPRSRPSFEKLYMDLAHGMAARSTCRRLAVGAVITSHDYRQIYAVGYNGNASGLPNDCDSEIPGACGCLHAEENAVINCDVARNLSKIVFCTHLPCVMCAKRLINLGGVARVLYATPYRKVEAIALFDDVGIKIGQIADYVVPKDPALAVVSGGAPVTPIR